VRDTRAGVDVLTHADTHVGAFIDRRKEAATEEMSRQAGHDFQREMAEHMLITSVASVPFLQTARTYVKASEHLHGDTIRFETTWREKPRNPAG
jgi:hypothetical protein